MPQEQTVVVEIPGVGNVEFPASMSQTDIAREAARLHSEAMRPETLRQTQGPSLMDEPKSAIDQLIDLLPMAGGTVGGIVGGVGGTVGGMGVGGVPGAIGGATLGGATGEAAKQLINRARGERAPGTMTGAAKSIATEGGIQGAAEAVGGAVAKGVGVGAKAVYRGYLKPSLAGVKIAEARTIVDTAMRERLPVTKGGEARAERLIKELNGQVNTILQNVKNKSAVDLHQVAEKVRAFAKAKYFKPGVDLSDYKAALEVADSIDRHPSLGIPPGVTPTRVGVSAAKANEVKQAVRPNSRAYGQQGSAPEAATRKVAGAEMRKSIEAVAPEVGPLNAREGQLIEALDAVKHAAGREENRSQLFGMPTLLAGTFGAEESFRKGDPLQGALTALAARAALSPAAMTRIALVAARLSKNGYGPAAAVRLALQAVQGEDAKNRTQSQP